MENLAEILDRAFKQLSPIECDDILISIGSTGCGKSTLLGSLVTGAKNMHQIKVGKAKKIIDYKPNVEWQPFKIGHEQISETFYPKFVKSPSGNFYIADVAGLYDNNGEMIELINSIIMKKLFTMSSRVRFLIPIPYKSLEGGRGKAVKDHIKMLLNVFKGNIRDVSCSIFPVVTKVKPKESGFDLESV